MLRAPGAGFPGLDPTSPHLQLAIPHCDAFDFLDV